MNTEKLQRMVEVGELKQLHTSLCRGYVSRKSDGVVTEYSGRFGDGYTLFTPNYDSTRYSFVTYYIKNN